MAAASRRGSMSGSDRRSKSRPAIQVATVRNDKGARDVRALSPSAPPLSTLLSRRAVLMGASMFAGAACAISPRKVEAGQGARFDPLPGPQDALAPGYSRQVVIRWGDPLWTGRPDVEPMDLDAEEAEFRFGYNNDYVAFFPLPKPEGFDEAGLLVINHEYPTPHLMFPGITDAKSPSSLTAEQARATLSAVGMTVIEIRRRGEAWAVVPDSHFARRVTARTPIRISGPAAGDRALMTSADPSGEWVFGTHDNCNGGMTPWGTYLSGEEGSSGFFGGDISGLLNEAALRRYHYSGLDDEGDYAWPRAEQRFNLRNEPNEPNRFEWVVELDPFDPEAPPVKRTALGRFAHEGAHCAVCPDGRVAVYLGDDWEFEYIYKFVTRDAYNPDDRAANRNLLDNGVLHVARFDAEGHVDWLPLVHGEGPLTQANGFSDQADVLVRARVAADLLGATPMDSPEGYQPNPKNGRVYVVLTGNEAREPGQENPANPRARNEFGHLLELVPPERDGAPDHAARRYDWRVLLLCGGRKVDATEQGFDPRTEPGGRFVAPDNINFDPAGRLWICSDGPGELGEDGLWVMPLDGPDAGFSQLVYRPPLGAECCGPAFTPSGETMFVSVQHPAENLTSLDLAKGFWPDYKPGQPPRPSVIAITRNTVLSAQRVD